MKKTSALFSIFGVLTLACVGTTPVSAQQPQFPAGQPLPSATRVENVTTVNFLHHMNMMEIRMANQALRRLTNPTSIRLARVLIADHQANERQVVAIATQQSWPLINFQASTFEAASERELNSLDSASFDQAFVSSEREDHQDALQRLQRFQSTITDPALLNLITQTIPSVQNHLQLAGGRPFEQPGCVGGSEPGTVPSPQEQGEL